MGVKAAGTLAPIKIEATNYIVYILCICSKKEMPVSLRTVFDVTVRIIFLNLYTAFFFFACSVW